MQSNDLQVVLIAIVAITIYVVVKGGVGYLIGKGKGKGGLGFTLGLLLGIIGWIIIAVIPGDPQACAIRSARACRKCRRKLPPGVLKCRHCARAARAAIPPTADGRIPCPLCAEMILQSARLCRFCKAEL